MTESGTTEAPKQAHDYLTPAEVAEVFKVSERTVYRWCEAGTLRHIKVGGTVRIPRAALDELDEEAS